MPRFALLLLVLLASVLMPGTSQACAPGEVEAVDSDEGCACCPGIEGEDCCAFDFGACCAQAHSAVQQSHPVTVHARHVLPPEVVGSAALHLLLPRDNGPPPTPPPIG